ncbi:zinc finger protein 184-like [Folsomia candida]|uniref:Zinc finger protein 26 n=1 Tax=Folsomia candida TaxID=158441 RepID=A0A226DKN2_FOLCA|nr:zinc finger protein 184-like [Folsomia candida]XP_035713670.1 zinc finger protein 184-like [Folsomia candida]OXA45161.1 Zinc finger protein 26 [Folsomia candida]
MKMDLQPGKTWKCSKCSKTFALKCNFTKHVITHDPDAKVKCKICGKILKNPDTLSHHMTGIHTNRKRPSCDICHRVFNNSVTLRKHTEVIHSTSERPRLPCGFLGCEKTFLDKGSASRHIKIDHAENPVRFPCTLCGNQFKSRADLEKHIATHTTEKPYNCATCGRGFSQMGSMKSHERVHLEKSTREIFKCDVCPQTFLGRDGLQRHIRQVHDNQRNYPCAFGGQRFSCAYNLKRHVEAVHATNEEKIHSCDKCQYKSNSKTNLAQHVRSHNVANWRECYFCKKHLATFHTLVRHCSRIHCLEK